MVTVTIACSSTHFSAARALADRLRERGVVVHLPAMADDFDKAAGHGAWRPLVARFLAHVDESRVLYVLAPGGVVGLAVASEIGYARAKGVQVVTSEALADGALAALVSGVRPPDSLATEYGWCPHCYALVACVCGRSVAHHERTAAVPCLAAGQPTFATAPGGQSPSEASRRG